MVVEKRFLVLATQLGNSLNKILPKSNLEHWKDAYLEATNKLNLANKNSKIITELINNTSVAKLTWYNWWW